MYLITIIKKAEIDGVIRGVSLCVNGPRISHLLFADDNLVFCRASISECVQIQSILHRYEQTSGQSINGAKTSIFFSSNTRQDTRVAIAAFLGVPSVQQYEKYLGLPASVGRNKKKSFSAIKDRIWKKLKGWKEKLLSQAGREVLIKAVIQVIPTYTMSCFKLPKCLVQDIESLTRKFWWGYRGEQQKIHWISWDKLCLPKKEGGMGFRELNKFNDSLLAKQIWRLKTCENSLFHKVFKAKFFLDCSIMQCDNPDKGSYAWKSLLQARYMVDSGASWRVGDGFSVAIRSDKWLPKNPPSLVISPPISLPVESSVSDLIDQENHIWKAELIQSEFLAYEASLILGIPLSCHPTPDEQVWFLSKDGKFTT